MWRFLNGLFLVGLLSVALGAQPPGRFPTRSYGFQDGLEDLSVNALAQTADGFLWAGTDSGLFRFDGQRFERRDLPQGYEYITALLAGKDGRLWAGTRHGLMVTDPGTDQFRTLSELQGRRLNSLGEDPTGGLWALSGDRLLYSREGRVFGPRGDWPGGEEVVKGVFAHPDADDVIVVRSRSLWIFRKSETRWVREEPPLAVTDELLLAAQDGLGFLWVRTSSALYRKGRTGSPWERMPGHLEGSPPNNLRMQRDREGWIWINTLKGVFRCRGAQAVEMKGGPKGFAAITGLVDHEGTPWIAANGVLQVLGGGRWRMHTIEEGLPSNVVWHLVRDLKGRPWLATDRGLVVGEEDGWKLVHAGQFSRLRRAPDGSLLAVGGPGGTLYRIDPRTRAVQTLRIDVLPASPESRGLAVEPDGRVWVSDFRDGVASGRMSAGRWTWERLVLAGKPPKGVWQIVQDPRGTIFLATQAGAFILEDGTWSSLGETLPLNPFSALRTLDGDVWVFYFDRFCMTRHRREAGTWKRIDEWRPLADRPNAPVLSNALAADGRVWVGTTRGMGLLDLARKKVDLWYSPGEGIPSADSNNHALVAEPDGTVWYGTTEGVGCLRPPERSSPAIPRPALLGWKGGGKPLAVGGPAPELAPGKPLEARFALNTYLHPFDTFLEARLEGIDSEWVKLQEQRLRFPSLQPGSYRLEVRGNGPGREPGPALTLEFRILPHWWQTWWAVLLYLGALVLVVLAAVRIRHGALLRHNLELQREVDARTEELKQANARLEGVSRSKSMFVASMSHELRTPLNAIMLFSELLLDDAREREDEASCSNIDKIMSAGKHLMAVINGVLDLSKIEAGEMKVDFAEEDVGSIVREVVETMRPLAEKGSNRILAEVPRDAPRFLTDRTKLRQILLNLGGNACKFTANGTITFAMESAPDALAFEVRDSGHGMTEEEVGRLFRNYEQVGRDVQKRFGGTGLGLAISARMVDLMGGSITVRSSPGVGSIFRVEFPRPREMAPTSSELQAPGSPTSSE